MRLFSELFGNRIPAKTRGIIKDNGTGHSSGRSGASCRKLRLESLEERQLLTVTPADYAALCDTWSHFDLPESPDNVNIIEIEADDLSIAVFRNAINSASNSPENDLILIRTTEAKHSLTFSESDYEFLINADPVTSGSLTILATGDLPLTLDAMGYSRLFRVTQGNVQLGNLTLSGGSTSTDIQGNVSSCAVGGGIAIASNANLILDKVTVQNCTANGIFDDNNLGMCSMGGGIYNAGSLSVFHSFVTSNTAESGLVNTLERTAYGAGGGIFNAATGKLFLHDTSVRDNTAESETIIIPGGEGSTESAVSVKQFGQGGGLYNSGKATIDGKTIFEDNFANHGGAIYAKANCFLSITETTFLNNEAKEFGGALCCVANSETSLSLCTFRGNQSGLYGGALYCESNLTCVNTIFSGNKTPYSGGAIFFEATQSILSMTNVTMTGNTAGNGAGIMSGSKKSELLLINSIVVNNRDYNGIVIDISGTGIFRGINTLSSFTAWSNNETNYIYDSAIPLFVSDYDFTNNTEGNYHLVYDQSLQAIDTGSVSAAWDYGCIDSTSLDFDGLTRISGNSIDLGAYEYNISDGFESCFPENLKVQQGCNFNLQTKGKTDSHGNVITNYLIDLDGDGDFELSGSSLWISWNELYNLKYERGCFYIKAQNSEGDLSYTRLVTVSIVEALPSIYVKKTSFLDDRLLRLSLSVYTYGKSGLQWIIDWGDKTDPDPEYNGCSFSLITSHYYEAPAEISPYIITLRLIDANGNGGNITYFIGTHTILKSQESISEILVSSLPDETPAIAIEEEEILPISPTLENRNLQEPIRNLILLERQINNIAPQSETPFLSIKSIPFMKQTENAPFEQEQRPVPGPGVFIPVAKMDTLDSILEDDIELLNDLNKNSVRVSNLTLPLENDIFADDDLDGLFASY